MTHNSGEGHGDFFALSKRVASKILALVVSDSLKALMKIAYPEWDIMEKCWKFVVFVVLTSRRLFTLDVKCCQVLHNYTSVACCYKVGIRFLYLPLNIYIAIYIKAFMPKRKWINCILAVSPGKLGNFVLCSFLFFFFFPCILISLNVWRFDNRNLLCQLHTHNYTHEEKET